MNNLLRCTTTALVLSLSPLALADEGAEISQEMIAPATGPEASLETGATNIDPIAQGAQKFIDDMAARGIGFLSNKSLSIEQQQQQFRQLLNESFDMKTIARFALGRYWRTSTEAEKEEYLQLFNDMIVRIYSKRFNDYEGHALKVTGARLENETDTTVFSDIIPLKGPKIAVNWRVRHKNGTYRIVDIIVEGVSMSLTQRSDFASVIQRGGGKLEVLLEHMRQKQDESP